MQYVQTVLFQIMVERVNEFERADGLFGLLEKHKAILQQYDAFVDMWVLRSINESGPVQILIQTRWSDAADLIAYEESGHSLEALLPGHDDLILPDTLQVCDMQVLM